MMRKTTLFACGTAIAALVLSGCAAKKEAGSPSAAGEEVTSMSVLAARVGELSEAKQAAHVKMSMDGAGESIKGEGDMRFGAEPAMDLTVAIPEMAAITMRFIDDTFYIKLPDDLEPGKPWVKIDTNGSDPISKALGTAVKQMKENGDPAQTLKQLEEAGEITDKKSEQLDGKDMTHYSITVDVKKLMAKQTDPDTKKAMEEASKIGLEKFPVEVWLDSVGLPARITMEVPFTDPATQKADKIDIGIDYSDWGKPVNVTVPPASEVAELPR